MLDLTEKLLNEAGGWQAMKHARALYETGRVVSSNYTAPLLKGLVREGDIEYRAGLKISSRADIENICTCRASREWGTICAHSLAVGLAAIRPRSLAAARLPERPAPIAAPVVGPFFSETEGEPIQIHFVFPPSFQAAWERGQITVGVEAETAAGRRLLTHALDAKTTYRCAGEDVRALDVIRALNGGAIAGMLVLSRDPFLDLLNALPGRPHVTFGKKQPVVVATDPLKPRLVIERTPEGETVLRAEIPEGALLVAGSMRAAALQGNTFRLIAPGLPPPYLELLREKRILGPDDAAGFVARELPLLKSFFTLPEDPARGAGDVTPASPDFTLTLEGSLNHLTAALQCAYGKRLVTVGVTSRAEAFTFSDPDKPGYFYSRNPAAEEEALAHLTENGFTGPDGTGHFILRGERSILNFFARELPRLQRIWKVSIGSRFGNITGEIERVRPEIDIRGSGENWFDMSVALSAGGERFSSAEIQRLLQTGQNYVRLKNNRLAVFDGDMLDELQQVLTDCDPKQMQPGSYRIDRVHAGYLEGLLGDAPGFQVRKPPEWNRWTAGSGPLEKLESIPVGPLEGVLRPYQRHGIDWICFLAKNGFAGILADEMGLGKTVQALAFLEWLRLKGGEGSAPSRPSLVVCPSSLIHNWNREAATFAPGLAPLILEGPDRDRLFSQLPQAALAITSYPLLRRDIDRYRRTEFQAVVLDEAQHIKNPDTQNAQAAAALRARHRLVLTGTPVENSVRDLWSIMQFLMPGYFGSRDDFRDRYEQPISRGDTAAQNRLTKRLRPFLLRRLKKNVITDIPDKLEQVSYAELTTQQRTVYSQLLDQTRSQLSQADSEKNQGKVKILMLTALLRLRQACCDLRLLNLPGIGEEGTSGKLDLLDELLQEAIDGGHRVLLFSQFVSMLWLLSGRLEAAGTPFCYLDGQTKDRMAVVDRFQLDSAIPIFLISLKAGGVGLNLTAADTVIHFDPWWNPAVEAQATDRAHRIGQKNVVTAYKLIARDTVEEKILNLQKRKREMIDATIESEEPLMTSLSMTEIQSLLE